MKINEATAFYSSLSEIEQQKFLAQFANYLTVIARDCYEPGTENIVNQPKMRKINEIQHQISSHLLALLEKSDERYPNDVLLKIILENSDDNSLKNDLFWAFGKVANKFLVAV